MPDQKKQNNSCLYPFHHVMIHADGTFNICCFHKLPQDVGINIKHHDHQFWLNTDYVQQVRQTFQANQRHAGCEMCWLREDQGFDSLRTRTAKEFAILPNNSDRVVKNIEIDLGNLCNLRCLMCNENNSSAILAENIKLGINKIDQDAFSWDEHAYDNLQKLLDTRPYLVSIRGGEPFYNKKLLSIVNDIPVSQARDMILHITTNGTVWNQQWYQALKKFRLVRLMFSVDAVGSLYEYIRYPASWSMVEKNILEMASLPNVKCLVHCVGQNLNILGIADLIDWCDSHAMYLEIEKLQMPIYLQMHNLPESQKRLAVTVLDNLSKRHMPPHLHKFVTSSARLLDQTVFDPELWQTFVSNISQRDALRGNTFTNFIKESQC